MSKNILLYIKEEGFISTSYYIDKEEQIYSINSELNNLAKRYFLSLPYYRKSVNKQLGLKYNIPIYFSPTLLLFRLKSKNVVYYINYFNILKICYEEGVVIIFKGGHILEVEVKKKVVLQQLQKIDQILVYMNKLEL